ncbi:MAG: L,D-transpeptidase family protein [Methylocystaceae bacterium]
MRNHALIKVIISLIIIACFVPTCRGWLSRTASPVFSLSASPFSLNLFTSAQATSRYIVIDTAAKELRLYINETLIKKYDVAVGTRKTPTPIGDFTIVNKDRNWGTGFGSRWMGLNVPWGIFGIHGTNKPWSIGASASHGCIRMHNRQVEELFSLVPVGTPVIIINSNQPYPRLRGRNLKRGLYGQDVVYVQRRLREIGLYGELADGRYGVMTEIAVSYFQFLNGCKPNGIVDRSTYDMLLLSVAPPPKG